MSPFTLEKQLRSDELNLHGTIQHIAPEGGSQLNFKNFAMVTFPITHLAPTAFSLIFSLISGNWMKKYLSLQ